MGVLGGLLFMGVLGVCAYAQWRTLRRGSDVLRSQRWEALGGLALFGLLFVATAAFVFLPSSWVRAGLVPVSSGALLVMVVAFGGARLWAWLERRGKERQRRALGLSPRRWIMGPRVAVGLWVIAGMAALIGIAFLVFAVNYNHGSGTPLDSADVMRICISVLVVGGVGGTWSWFRQTRRQALEYERVAREDRLWAGFDGGPGTAGGIGGPGGGAPHGGGPTTAEGGTGPEEADDKGVNPGTDGEGETDGGDLGDRAMVL